MCNKIVRSLVFGFTLSLSLSACFSHTQQESEQLKEEKALSTHKLIDAQDFQRKNEINKTNDSLGSASKDVEKHSFISGFKTTATDDSACNYFAGDDACYYYDAAYNCYYSDPNGDCYYLVDDSACNYFAGDDACYYYDAAYNCYYSDPNGDCYYLVEDTQCFYFEGDDACYYYDAAYNCYYSDPNGDCYYLEEETNTAQCFYFAGDDACYYYDAAYNCYYSDPNGDCYYLEEEEPVVEEPTVNSSDPDAALYLQAINVARAAGQDCGGTYYPPVAPLQWSERLYQAALAHATDMATNGFFSHTGSDGSNFSQRAARAGTGAGGENIAGYSSSYKSTIAQWLRSPGHCKNMMRSRFNSVGMAKAQGNRGTYWVQVF